MGTTGAYVEHSFKRGFILDEGKVRKIRDTLEGRLSKRVKPLAPTYKVYRGDSYSYTTESIDDVIREDNEDWRRITRLDILVEEKDQLDLRLSFHGKGVEVNIVGDDRDEVFLLFSDLRDYIQNEVAITRTLGRDSFRVAFLLLMFVFAFVLMASMAFTGSEPQNYERALASKDLAEKVNFLIESAARKEPGLWFWVLLGGFGLFPIIILIGVPERVSKYLFPANVFIFGKQLQLFERRQRVRGNLLWVCVVGLVVSVVAGFLVWYATTPN